MWVKKSKKCDNAKDKKACFKKLVTGCMKFKNSKCVRTGKMMCKKSKGGKACMKKVVGSCMAKLIVTKVCKQHTYKKCGKAKMCWKNEMKGCFAFFKSSCVKKLAASCKGKDMKKCFFGQLKTCKK
jgi:hypothetical protein